MRLIGGCIPGRAAMMALPLMLLVVVSACTPKPDSPIYNIKKDTIYDNQETIVILELKMVDKTYSLDSYMPVLVIDQQYPLFFVDQQLQPLEWMMWHYWKTHGNANYFEAVCLFKAQPGTYGLSNLILEKQRTSNFDVTHRVNVGVGKKWRIPAQRLVYLGELQVEFTKRRIASDGRGIYQHQAKFNHEANNLPQVLTYFMNEYPKLYTQYEKRLLVLKPLHKR